MDRRVVDSRSNQVLHRSTTNARHERRKAAALAKIAERAKSIIEGFRQPSAEPVSLDPIIAHFRNKCTAGTLATGEHNRKPGTRQLAKMWKRRQEIRRARASFQPSTPTPNPSPSPSSAPATATATAPNPAPPKSTLQPLKNQAIKRL